MSELELIKIKEWEKILEHQLCIARELLTNAEILNSAIENAVKPVEPPQQLYYVKKPKNSKTVGFAKWYCGVLDKDSSDIRIATPLTEEQIEKLKFASGTEYYPVEYINQYKTSVLAKVIASKLDESKCKTVQPF